MVECRDITFFIKTWIIIGILFYFWPAGTFLVLLSIVFVGLLHKAINLLCFILTR
jgi:hypothetical protein